MSARGSRGVGPFASITELFGEFDSAAAEIQTILVSDFVAWFKKIGIEAINDETAVSLVNDEAGFAKDSEVMGNSDDVFLQARRQFADRSRFLA